MHLYVEGDGGSKLLKTACRKGFAEFLRKAGLAGFMPRVVACGSRRNAYDSFCTALENKQQALLLVDSEDPVTTQNQWLPWQHLNQRAGDQWQTPQDAQDDQCHLMVSAWKAGFWRIGKHLVLFSVRVLIRIACLQSRTV